MNAPGRSQGVSGREAWEGSGGIGNRDRLPEAPRMSVKVAACQIDPQLGEVDRNLERIERALEEAARSGVVLAVLPEAAVTGYAYSSLDEAMPVARRAKAVAEDRLALQAQRHGMAVICGSLEPEGDEIYNLAHI